MRLATFRPLQVGVVSTAIHGDEVSPPPASGTGPVRGRLDAVTADLARRALAGPIGTPVTTGAFAGQTGLASRPAGSVATDWMARLRDPRLAEPRLAEPRLAEPRLAEPRLAEPNMGKFGLPTGLLAAQALGSAETPALPMALDGVLGLADMDLPPTDFITPFMKLSAHFEMTALQPADLAGSSGLWHYGRIALDVAVDAGDVVSLFETAIPHFETALPHFGRFLGFAKLVVGVLTILSNEEGGKPQISTFGARRF